MTHQQITLPDGRYYQRNGEFYPSVTYVLSLIILKVSFLRIGLRKVGYSADYIVRKASAEGTQVHEMIEAYLNGEEMKIISNMVFLCTPHIFGKCFMKFVDWWEEYKPTLIEAEVHLIFRRIKSSRHL